MMNTPKNRWVKTLSVRMPDEMRSALDEIAEERSLQNRINKISTSVYTADIVREAILEYLRARGYDINAEVDRGGWRERTGNEED